MEKYSVILFKERKIENHLVDGEKIFEEFAAGYSRYFIESPTATVTNVMEGLHSDFSLTHQAK